ncbi:MAG TPA: hypothetical protein PLU38_04700 [Kiritimatiellia bacterium]|jgi:hypothetical protein|nr:MAG: hypothetical protein BWX70_00257 [Verrucomicrobia bacterium ADurb.Bin070]HPB10155.1 hypothetical protein [Kiritimatiellia bacterium]HQA37882.1 hypothetical protein [Kiritimatiellia bacterium]HQL50311.1 hypothetical protein [Kiritimatiellia bacterium]HQQ91149.1 hypothetical protein [Kiritimatiellia bacterium]
MKNILRGVLLLPLACLGGEAVLGVGGKLSLSEPAIEFDGGLFTKGWQRSLHGTGFTFADAKSGTCAFALKLSEAEQIAVQVKVVPAADGALRAHYTFTPKAALELSSLFVGTRFSAQNMIGGRWRADQKSGVFSETQGALAIFSGKIKELEIETPPPAKQRLVLAFDAPTSVLIQDDRRWGDTFGLRLGVGGTGLYPAGKPLQVGFTLKTHAPLTLTYARPVVLEAGPEWVTLAYEKEIVPGSALDFSGMGFADAPAGKYGWLKAVGPHFEFERKPGAAQRFYGVNFCGTANFPSQEQAEQLADRLVRLGYNSVRIHHHDNGCVQGSPDALTLNPGQMARLDGFLAACYKRGLYATTDLFVSRKVAWRHIGIDQDGQVEMQVFKALIAVHEPAFQNWAAFARAFLNHVNPHTGRRYADEPGMPFIALINEGSIGYAKAEARETPAMQAAWAAWLAEQRAKDPAYAEIPDKMPLRMSGREGAAVARFVADTEARMVARMKAFLREEIGCRALISNYNCGTHYTTLQPVREALYDYVDDHFYVDHPNFLDKRWALPSRCGNENPLRTGCTVPCGVAFTRLANKPFTVSEYNFSGPGMYRGVGGIMTGAMGALQDWSALWRFAYSHRLENMFSSEGFAGYFDVATDPLSQASDRASICLFLRRDLAPATPRAAIHLVPRPDGHGAALPEAARSVAPAWRTAAWHAQVGTYAATAPLATWRLLPESDAYATGTVTCAASLTNAVGPLVIDPARGAFTLDTERTMGGFAEEGRIAAGALTVTLRGAPATVWVSALDDQPVVRGRRLLLTHLTDVQNSGVKYADAARKILLSWGKTPYLVRAGQAEIELTVRHPETYTVYALATSGRRLGQVPARVSDGALCFTADVAHPEGARLLYEIINE